MSQIDSPFLIAFLRNAAARLEAERHRLCTLDGELGDGDHGTSMALGFGAISRRLSRSDTAGLRPPAILRAAAAAFIGEVGATVGPLYASGFLQAAALLDDRDLTTRELGDFIDALCDGIARRGGAALGDKTMLDAWLPAAQAAHNAAQAGGAASGVAAAALGAARKGADATKAMIASRGRAAHLRERNLGHLDPGAASAVILLEALHDTVADAA